MSMTASELRRLLDDVQRGDRRPGRSRRAHPDRAAGGAVRGPGLRPRRHPPRAAPGLSRGHSGSRQDSGPDCRHRRAHRRRGPDAAGDPRHAGGLRGGARRRARRRLSRRRPRHHAETGRDPARPGHDPHRLRRHVRPAGRRGSGGHGRADGQRGRPPLRRRRRRPPPSASRTAPARKRARVVIVVAGMEGALPSVVAGLVDVPGHRRADQHRLRRQLRRRSPHCSACSTVAPTASPS